MYKQLRFLTTMLLLAVCCGVWADTSTLTFTQACSGSGTANDGVVWTVTSDGTESNFDNTRGIHYGTSKAAVSYLTLTTSGISGTITNIVVNASGASSTSAKLDVKVGNSAFGSQKSLTGEATEYTFTGSATGAIEVKLSQSSAKKALYVKSIVVTYSNGGSETPTVAAPTFSPAAGEVDYGTNITLTQANAHAIVFTTNGDTPSWNNNVGTIYSNTQKPVVQSDMTVKAIAVAKDGDNFIESEVVSATYTVKRPAAPTFSPAAGAVEAGTEVSITAENGYRIIYTTNGDDPSYDSSVGEVYTDPITIDAETTIKAIAVNIVDASNNIGIESPIATASYTIYDPNAPGTENNPYTVAQAIEYINTLGTSTSPNEVYVSGIISQVDSYNSNYKSITYWISDDGTTSNQMQVYSGKGLNGADFSSKDDLMEDDIVTVKGKVKKYNSIYEFDYNNELVSLVRKELNYITLSGDYPTTFVEGREFSHEGIIVTAHYNDDSTMDVTENATFSEPDMTQIGEQDVTVSFNGKSVNYTITITEAPSHTATFSVNGEVVSTPNVKEGFAIEFPSNAEAPEGYSIVGWLAEEMSEPQDEAPANIINSAVMGNADVTYYAVLAVVTPGTATTTTDVLNLETTGVTGNTYTEWSGKTGVSGAVYAGQSAGENESIQLRSKNSNSGIVTTASGGNAKKVTVVWNDNTVSGRTLDIYGKDTAYEDATDLYGDNKGTKLGSIVCGTSTELTITGDYPFIGLRSNDGAMYLSSISIVWQTGTPDTYSNFCTTIPVPTISIAISDAGYATYVAADNVYFPEGVTAYIVSDVTASSIKLTEVLAVAKDVPVVVKGNAGTYDLEVVTADDCDDVTENKLLVSDGTVSDNILVLANKSNGVGFYTWAGGNLPAGKVYLVNPNSSREFFGFDEGVATSISTIDNGQWTMDNAYNLQGQKVGSEYKGIIIVNGKKFINK